VISFINDEGEMELVAECSAEFYFYPVKIFLVHIIAIFRHLTLRE